MKLNTFKTAAIAGMVTLTGAALSASGAENLHVNVPFSFMVGSTKMPAGNYNITQSENGMVTFSGATASAMVLTVPSDYGKNNATGLSFASVDSKPVLTSIQVSGSFSREIPNHAADRKVVLSSAR